jgi:hypothetical protein
VFNLMVLVGELTALGGDQCFQVLLVSKQLIDIAWYAASISTDRSL